MLYEIMIHLRNFFPSGIYKTGEYVVKDGTLELSFAKAGQWIRIEGSSFNDGVYQLPVSGLTDEDFYGIVSILLPPMALVKLAEEISLYVEKFSAPSAYTSEIFDGMSRTRATSSSGAPADWQTVYRERLNLWRKI